MSARVGFTAGEPPHWDLERFLRGDEVATAVITLERNRRTFAYTCLDVDAVGLALRVGRSGVTPGGLLTHLAWVEELYLQSRLAGGPVMEPFASRDPEQDWDDWRGRRPPTTARSSCATP